MPRTLLALTGAVVGSALAVTAAPLASAAPASAAPAHHHLSRAQAKAVYDHLVDAINAGSRSHALTYARPKVVDRMLAVHDDGEEATFGHAGACATHPHTAVCHGSVYEDEDVLHVTLTISAKTHKAVAYAAH